MMNRTYKDGAGKGDQGSALIVVMWIALGLVSIALYFCNSMLFEYRAADNASAGQSAQHAIEGARRYVGFVLENNLDPGYMPALEDYEEDWAAVGDATFWLIGRGDEFSSESDEPVYGLIDEASKLNLNTATFDMLVELPYMPLEFAAAIVDWRDEDTDVNANGGAEAADYLLLDPAYNCKDAAFESVEELRLVYGADWEIIYGEDMNRNGILDPNEDDGDESLPDDNQNGRLDFGLIEYLTVFSREPNKQADGSDRDDVSGRGNSYDSLIEYYLDNSGNMTPEEFADIEDTITVSEEEYFYGLVNINTAPAEVLACLPGIGVEFAEQIVANRVGRTIDELGSILWVLEVLDEQNARQAGPYITTRSYRFTADIAAVGQEGRGFRRSTIVFDAAESPIVVYRKDTTRGGWPLGELVRSDLESGEVERF